MAHRKRPIAPYIVPVAQSEMGAYHTLRVQPAIAAE
jgi:hypothetical protein